MGVQIGLRQAKPPALRHANETTSEFFYASEAAQVLGVPEIEYRQLRKLVEVVRDGRAVSAKAWARYSLADVAGMQIVIDLVGGPDVFKPGGRMRMRLQPVRDAIAALRKMGFPHPLIEVPLSLEGNRIVAHLRGVVIDPRTGQGLLVQVERRMEARFIALDRRQSLANLRADLKQLRAEQVKEVAEPVLPLN